MVAVLALGAVACPVACPLHFWPCGLELVALLRALPLLRALWLRRRALVVYGLGSSMLCWAVVFCVVVSKAGAFCLWGTRFKEPPRWFVVAGWWQWHTIHLTFNQRIPERMRLDVRCHLAQCCWVLCHGGDDRFRMY